MKHHLATTALTTTLILTACTPQPTPPNTTTITNDFRQAVTQTVQATGLPDQQLTYNTGKPYDTDYFTHQPLTTAITPCGDTKEGGLKYSYSVVIKGDTRYPANQWQTQENKVRQKWQEQGWEVKNVAPGFNKPGITIGTTTEHGVTILYSVAEGRIDYIQVDSPCLAELAPTPTN
ncbi:hypothetical protein ACN082_00215 [Rothia sp. CCM 9417]|uniref:hypothetical protein n=1 Tax=unclassified Rothia (in: high G+C Gram-positive bacteria) TaxID=2689056 RepID=UPI003ADB3096